VGQDRAVAANQPVEVHKVSTRDLETVERVAELIFRTFVEHEDVNFMSS
jgi:hypothetical protein